MAEPEFIKIELAWALPETGLYYVYSKRNQRPALQSTGGQTGTRGVLCFKSEAQAEQYMEMIARKPGGKRDKNAEPIRHVKYADLNAWIAQAKSYGPVLIYPNLKDGEVILATLNILDAIRYLEGK